MAKAAPTKLEAAHLRLKLGLLVQHSPAAAGCDEVFELAPAIAALIRGMDPPLSATFKARFCPFSNAAGNVTLTVSPTQKTITGREHLSKLNSDGYTGDSHADGAVAKVALQKYLWAGARGACAAALETNAKAAKQLTELIDSALQVTFRDLGRHNICEFCCVIGRVEQPH